MSSTEIASVVTALAVVLASAHIMAWVFEKLRQPRLVGEILAGVVLGPFLLGRLDPDLSSRVIGGSGSPGETIRLTLGFVYWLGLLLLMFTSGSEVRRVLAKENRKPTAWILGIGTPLPFALALAAGYFLPLEKLAGPAGHETSVRLVVSIAVAVTSIPVISRIFFDLGIIHTRFASLILGAALLEDIILWAVLAVATAMSKAMAAQTDVTGAVTEHVSLTLGFLTVGLFVAPRLLRAFSESRFNVVRASSPSGYTILVLLGFTAAAAALDVNLVFAAFLAGFGLVGGMGGTQRARFAEQIEAIKKVAFGAFIPVYFVVVGAKLQFGNDFSAPMLIAFLLSSTLLCFTAVGLAARLAGFRGIEIFNIAVASNARGGPGIVLASVAYEAKIINGAFFTTLVLTAILTSQLAGGWLALVLRKGWVLLREDMDDLPRAGDQKQAEVEEPAKV